MRWFTSDLHAGHCNIVVYCGRPFVDVAAMNAAMFANWSAVVAPTDEVWVLGDVVLGPDWRELLHTIGALPGRKVLVPGNHDRAWHGHGAKHAKYLPDYRVAFDEILPAPVRLVIDGRDVRAAHLPYVDEERDRQDKYAKWRPADEGLPLLCGHVHERWQERGRQFNVGVDAREFAPVAETTIVEWLRSL